MMDRNAFMKIMEKWGILDDVTERRKKGIRDDRQA
jgi:hypothetical protein